MQPSDAEENGAPLLPPAPAWDVPPREGEELECERVPPNPALRHQDPERRQRHELGLGVSSVVADLLSPCRLLPDTLDSKNVDSKNVVTLVPAAPSPRQDQLAEPLETVLASAGCVALRRSDAVDDFLRRRPPREVRSETHEDVVGLGSPDVRRALPLCYVVGPRPADRTRFALLHLRNFRNHAGLPSVVVHWPLFRWHDNNSHTGGSRDRAPSDLVECFLALLNYRIQSTFHRTWRPRKSKLKMHVCVVLDDVDRPEQLKFFENKQLVARFVRGLDESYFAASLVVVICAPDSATRRIDDDKDAYVFRLEAGLS